MDKTPVTVGVLSFHESKETKAICNAIEALGHRPEWLREENVVLHIDDDGTSLEPDVDIVINRLLLSNTDQPAEDLGIANALDAIRPMLNPPQATAVASHKIATEMALSRANVPTPETVMALGAGNVNRYREKFGPTAVYKTAIGTHGGGAWRVNPTDQITGKVGSRRAFLQRFINRQNKPTRDLRVYIVDGRILAAMYRYATGGDWRTNVARGGSVEDATNKVPDCAGKLALEAARVIGLDYAGVDLIEGDDGWYVLEVNPTAGFKGLFSATEVSPAPHIATLAIERLGGEVDPNLVEDIAQGLDDSRPSCLPVHKQPDREDAIVLGNTERIAVSGTTGTTSIVAKADPTLERTHISLRLAAEIGAGPIHILGSNGLEKGTESMDLPVVDLVIGIGGSQHTVEATIVDVDQLTHPVHLGNDVLRHYHLDEHRDTEIHRTIE